MANPDTFKVSAALKDIIGKELITDEFVAVFELVKNSFDAYSKNVEVVFEYPKDPSKAKILIKDDGIGMNINDLRNKWLFVAYSAKKLGLEHNDYRDKIKINRVFAGAKGVGRFSCDRLGKRLKLISVKDEIKAKVESLVVHWEDFENVDKEEFINIEVKLSTLEKYDAIKKHGTHLEITHLRDTWDRDRILKLKRSLVKLVNPNQSNDSKNFKIKIVCKDEISTDRKKNEGGGIRSDWEKVNGIVKNDIFETLKIKTSNIHVEITDDGKYIDTTIEDREDLIFKLREKNPFPKLANIRIFLFQLNRAAKYNFHRIMGMESVKYGSIFMYKNGFRIYPYGEEGEDLLNIDRRKAQGYNRFLGTRDLIGRIEINGKQPELREITSRDGGLVKTEAYDQLVDFFISQVLRRLENYVVNIVDWGDPKIDKTTKKVIRPELMAKDVKIDILEMIAGFINSKNVVSINYDENFLKIIQEKQDKNVDKITKRVAKIARDSDNKELQKEARLIQKAVTSVKHDTEKAEKKRKEAEAKLKYVVGQNLFLKEEIGDDTQNLEAILHHIDLATEGLSMDIEALVKELNGNADPQNMMPIVQRVSAENQKIKSFAKYFKKVNFDIYSKQLKNDIVSFVNEYIENIYKRRSDLRNNARLLNVDLITEANLEFKFGFSPIDIVIVLDNLLSNAKKNGATDIVVTWIPVSKTELILSLRDNGSGIETYLLDQVFDFGFTTQHRGSGLGLYHVYKLINEMKGDITIDSEADKFADFRITFRK